MISGPRGPRGIWVEVPLAQISITENKNRTISNTTPDRVVIIIIIIIILYYYACYNIMCTACSRYIILCINIKPARGGGSVLLYIIFLLTTRTGLIET